MDEELAHQVSSDVSTLKTTTLEALRSSGSIKTNFLKPIPILGHIGPQSATRAADISTKMILVSFWSRVPRYAECGDQRSGASLSLPCLLSSSLLPQLPALWPRRSSMQRAVSSKALCTSHWNLSLTKSVGIPRPRRPLRHRAIPPQRYQVQPLPSHTSDCSLLSLNTNGTYVVKDNANKITRNVAFNIKCGSG